VSEWAKRLGQKGRNFAKKGLMRETKGVPPTTEGESYDLSPQKVVGCKNGENGKSRTKHRGTTPGAFAHGGKSRKEREDLRESIAPKSGGRRRGLFPEPR